MTARKLPLTLLLMMVIVSTISFLPVQEAKASTELAYDNGTQIGSYSAGGYGGVRFSLPSGVSWAKLLAVKYYAVQPAGSAPSGEVTVYITGADHVTLLASPLTTTPTIYNDFSSLDVSGLNIAVSGDFFVVVYIPPTSLQWIGSDTGPGAGRSYSDGSLAAMNTAWCDGGSINIMIRAVIDPTTAAPVGGVVMPTSKLQIVAPFAALAGLIAVVSAVVVVERRRD